MPRYAIKIGEIHLVSETPITKEEREKAERRLLKDPAAMVTAGGVFISVNGIFAD